MSETAAMNPGSPKAFISYHHDSAEHRQRVLALADRLCSQGVDVELDQYEEAPREGWPRWMNARIQEADYIVMVCTATYEKRFWGKEADGRGLGVNWEGAIITQQLYEQVRDLRGLVPVVFSADELRHVPLVLRGARIYVLDGDEGHEDLFRHLTSQPRAPKPELGDLQAAIAALGATEVLPDIFTAEPVRSAANRADGEVLEGRHPRPAEERVRRLSAALEDAYRRKEELQEKGGDTTTVQEEILDLRRKIREGGQLRAGDFLLDGRFKLIEVIGRGGFGTVWKASDRKTHELVAIKVLHGQHAEDRSIRERFFRGARQMRKLAHQAIVRVVVEKCEEGGYYFFVMEYLPGGDLRRAILAGRFSIEDRLRMILKVGKALAYAHQHQVIHRDVKPANVLLTTDNTPKLTDFDLVHAVDTTGGTRTVGLPGTFIYSAPELMQDRKNAKPTGDVYSLGMTTIFALHGADLPPDVFKDSQDFIDQLGCAAEVKEVLRRAVSWDARERYSTVADFCHYLEAAAFPVPLAAVPEPKVTEEVQPGRAPKASRWKLALPASLAVAVLILGFYLLMVFGRPADESDHQEGTGDPVAEMPGESALPDEEESTVGPPPEIAPKPDEGEEPTPTMVSPESERVVRDGPEEPEVPAERMQEIDGSVLVYVPGGSFSLGATDIDADSRPVHRVELSPFRIGKYPITNEQYAHFLQENPEHPEPAYATDSRFNAPRQPVVGVSWYDARDYCRWAGMQLPSEAQWEAAARGPDAWKYPWGNAEPTPKHGNFGPGKESTTAVDAYPAGMGLYGTMDQAGNAWEWCADVWDADAYADRAGKRDPVSTNGDPDLRALRGGSWAVPGRLAAAAFRTWDDAATRRNSIGFRCALPADRRP